MTLVDAHRDELRASGLTDETIARAGIFSAPERQTREVLGYGAGAGLVFPYRSLNGSASYARVKLDNPGADGKRYRSPAKQPNRLYVPALLEAAILADTSTPLWLTEGEKKALKACQEGLSCLALPGVWSWRMRDREDRSIPIPDLDHVAWNGRLVYVVFDSDLATNPRVKDAEAALARELSGRGAHVLAVRLPGGPNGQKVGLDDYLLTHSVDTLCALEPVEISEPTADALPYIETLAAFLAEDDPPLTFIFPELLPADVIMLIHGEARARKSLAAFWRFRQRQERRHSPLSGSARPPRSLCCTSRRKTRGLSHDLGSGASCRSDAAPMFLSVCMSPCVAVWISTTRHGSRGSSAIFGGSASNSSCSTRRGASPRRLTKDRPRCAS
jgi:hypothetical protein